MIFVVLVGFLVYGLISFLVAAMVWMFTTVFGVCLLAFLVLAFIANLLAPETEEDDDEEGR